MPQKLGQHFLIRDGILERIAAAACPVSVPLVIEIGPGRGALTGKLLERSERVIAIELDSLLAQHLRTKFSSDPRLEIVEADVLATDLSQWGSAPIVGNLPYYITSPILGRTLRSCFSRAIFLMQKEVAHRLVATPGTRDYGYLTLETALFAKPRYLFEVKPGAFQPPPKVDSAVVLLEPRPPEPGAEDREGLLRFIGHCFRHKRKTLRNNLVAVYGREAIENWPEASLRAEQIPLEGFVEMYRRLA